MASYLQFTLDTTPPNAQIFTPDYTTKQATTHINVVADEIMTNIFNINIVDSKGVVRNYSDRPCNQTSYSVDVQFLDYPEGNVTINASVVDIVGNVIQLAPRILTIYSATLLNADVSHFIPVNMTVNDSVKNKVELGDSVTHPVILTDEGRS